MQQQLSSQKKKPTPQAEEEAPVNEIQEKELIRLLLNYAGKEMHFEIENEDNQPEVIQVRVMDFIVSDIQADKLNFENHACQRIFNAFADSLNNRSIPQQKSFTEHHDPDIQHLAIDLLSTKYSLSKNWEHRHKIYVTNEEDNIKSSVMHAVYSFKLKKLELMIRETQQAIRDEAANENTDEDELLRLMETYKDLTDKRLRFAAALNRVVTK